MPLLQFNDLQFPEWLQGASWEVRLDVVDGSGEFGLRLNTARSGRRRVLADVTLRLLGRQLMAFESFCVNDLNNCKDKFLANYPDGSGVKNGVVKIIDGYTVNTDGREHIVNFTIELPTLPNKPSVDLQCVGNFTSDSFWNSTDFNFVGGVWESTNNDVSKTLDLIGATTAFKPDSSSVTIQADSDTPYKVEVFYVGVNIDIGQQVIIGANTIELSDNSTPYNVSTLLKWPSGVSAENWTFQSLVFVLSTGYNNFNVNCIDFY